MPTVEVCETFTSIQGESTYAGLPCFFIRLSRCNLDCTWCDTPQAKNPGIQRDLGDLVEECLAAGADLCEITGGEPLMQEHCLELVRMLIGATRRPVLVETNGSFDISMLPDEAIAVVDMKTPGSGQSEHMDFGNLGRLRAHDEVKFVIASREDYEWARDIVGRYNLVEACNAVLFSPETGGEQLAALPEWMIADKLGARLHLQLHKLIGVR